MSRAIDKPLDDVDPINQSYCLEVCSPGIERELVRDEHFERFIGADIKIRLIRANSEGKKELYGKLLNISGNIVQIESEGQSMNIDKKDTASIRLDDFDD